MRRHSRLLLGVVGALIVSAQAHGQPAPSTATSLGVSLALPEAYESTISALSALATSGAAALKTSRANARSLAIRAALAKTLLASGPTVTSIVLDKDNQDPTLGEVSLLCVPRQNYVSRSIALNYINTLVQNISAVSAKPAAPNDIAGAIKLLLATSNYAIADAVKVDPASTANLTAASLSSCKQDLSAYEQDYYGATTRAAAPNVVPAAVPAEAAPIDTFAFLGPIGSLIDTFLSILQPVLIDASQAVDQSRRQTAITTALGDPDIQSKIAATGRQLATSINAYARASKHNQVGLFVEQLVAIRATTIDLSNVAECKGLAPSTRLPSDAPNAAFVSCWHAAWTKLQPLVESLNGVADSYDTLADSTGNIDAQKLVGTILADYAQIKSGANAPQDLAVFANDVTEFITFANAVANAVSSGNIGALKSAATVVLK